MSEIIEALDTDGSGTIDYTEFITAAIDKVFLLSADNLRAVFDLIDKDKSGTISVAELKGVFEGDQNKKDE